MSLLTVHRLRELLSYDPDAGLFSWQFSRGPIRLGMQAGTVKDNGYVQIKVDGAFYRAHRLAWFYTHGEWPAHDIDHINGDRADNRLANLRCATRAENMQNARKARRNSKTGLLGASPSRGKGGGFRADIKVNGKQTVLGTFSSAQEAHEAYLTAKRVMHPMGTI